MKSLTLFFVIIILALSINVSAQNAGKAVYFDGKDDIITIPNLINGKSRITIEAWFKYSDTKTWRWIYANGPGFVDIGAAVKSRGNKIRYHFKTSKSKFTNGNGNVGLSPNTWFHFAMTYDGRTVKGYINSKLDFSKNITGKIKTTQTQAIGAGYWNNREQFKGYIDEVRIWNRALSQSQIQTNMKQELKGNENGLIGYYNFNSTLPKNVKIHGNAQIVSSNAPVKPKPEPIPKKPKTTFAYTNSSEQLRKQLFNEAENIFPVPNKAYHWVQGSFVTIDYGYMRKNDIVRGDLLHGIYSLNNNKKIGIGLSILRFNMFQGTKDSLRYEDKEILPVELHISLLSGWFTHKEMDFWGWKFKETALWGINFKFSTSIYDVLYQRKKDGKEYKKVYKTDAFFNTQTISLYFHIYLFLKAEIGYYWRHKSIDPNYIQRNGLMINIGISAPLYKIKTKEFYSKKRLQKRNLEIKNWVSSEMLKRSKPCELETELTFSDKGSYTEDQVLEGGETGKLKIKLHNKKGTAFNVQLELEGDYQGIIVSRNIINVGTLDAGETKEFKINLKAGTDLKDGKVVYTVKTLEERGYDAAPQKIQFNAKSIDSPSLKIAEMKLNDGKVGRANGNNNEIIENGETVEFNFLVVLSAPIALISSIIIFCPFFNPLINFN